MSRESRRDTTCPPPAPSRDPCPEARGRPGERDGRIDELIERVAAETEREVAAAFAAAFGPLPSPVAVFRHVEDGFPVLALRVWGAVVRASVREERFDGSYAGFARALLWYVELYQRAGMITREVRPTAVVRMLVALIHGFVVQRAVFGDGDIRLFHAGLRALALTPAAGPSPRRS
ncbi:hypothetical protein EDD29_7246 [Actinocorallia herbida]|uniref:Uncharacterized protein n=1 Tax=Actinocorallia herbida TaxID=58109 RepID=A0A3N1D7V9_9ACTN|nr:hypothetical protein [Actinocorallia herbida]ROO89549.1 hypothetical protein EDD29_7246 [Actinocorallia herbida]